MNKSLIALALFASLGSSLTPACAVRSSCDQGIEDYQAGRYRQSVMKLARATGADPANALMHYYLANALVKCGEHEEAAEEYRISYIIEPQGRVSEYCRVALRGYKKPLPTARDIQNYRDTARGAYGAGSGNVSVAHTPPLMPANANPRTDKALSAIRRQVDYEQRKHQAFGETAASSIMQNGEKEARDVDMEARMQIEAIRNTPRDPRSNTVAFENELKVREEAVRKSAKDEQERIRREATERANRYQKVAQMRQRSLNEVADNLESQLSEKSTSGVKLIAEGTDLYVRNYASGTGPRSVPDARAAVARIYGHSPEPDSTSSTDGYGDANAGQADLRSKSVRGKVLN